MEPVVKQVFFMYDNVMKRITAFIEIALEKQEQIVKYVNETYSCVTVQAQGYWLRLDFDKDESVSVDDLKNSMLELYEFLKNFSVLNEMSVIKCQLYAQAIEYMKAELNDNQNQKKKSTTKINGKNVLKGEGEPSTNGKFEMNGKQKNKKMNGVNGNHEANGKAKNSQKIQLIEKQKQSDDVKD